jgi:PAS domain S-box-containing protein
MSTAPSKFLKVLAVDDNRTNLHILQVFLKKLGHQVISAENGEEAVRQFANERPDIVLLDIMMPVMDGFEAARQIKAMECDHWTPVVFLSALNRDENLLEGLEAGADDYLTKPINFVVLEAKLRSMQRSLQLQQESSDALNRLKAISDNIFEAIITIDERGTIVTVNRATEQIFSWSAAELLGQNVNMLMPEPFHTAHDGYLARYLADGEARIVGQEREVNGKRKDGTVFPINLGVTEVILNNQRMFIGVIRDISDRKRIDEQLKENALRLQEYFNQTQSEQHLAMRLMEMQLHRPGLKDKSLRYKVIPAENFSGDIVAAARSPEGRFYALLADATGHGLTAAISVMPVLAIFYRMTASNRKVREIISELNQQLKESMPTGRFVAATLICLDAEMQSGEIWVGGTPEAILCDRWGREEQVFNSANLPLGIVDTAQLDCQPVKFSWLKESQIILCSDGLLEAENHQGQQFGQAGLNQAIVNTSPQNRFTEIETALRKHLDGALASDDISLMIIDCP